MAENHPVGLAVARYRCFGKKPQGFESVKTLNLVIGRNNSGKSALLDAVMSVATNVSLESEGAMGPNAPRVYLTRTLELDDFQTALRAPSAQSKWGRRIQSLASRAIDKRVQIGLQPNRTARPFLSFQLDGERELVNEDAEAMNLVCSAVTSPLEGKSGFRIAAERDITAEPTTHGYAPVTASGQNATSAIERVLNFEALNSDLVQKQLLADLNDITGPDAEFIGITVQRFEDGGHWCVFLEEAGKGRVSLERSGSGLKTILLVLVGILLVPVLSEKPLSEYVFAFEELENNLHPGLQRRLLRYVERKALSEGFCVFLTTHSPAIIDLFAGREHAQVIHVAHNGSEAACSVVSGLAGAHDVLNDLDVRASDLLQANGVIWVEGISDRYYIGKWIDLLCREGDIETPVEGIEYTFLEYGGKCLSHYEFRTLRPNEVKDEDLALLIRALSISRNHYVVMDSDLSDPQGHLRETKRRVMDSAKNCWVTGGREVENYLPPAIARAALDCELARWESVASKKPRLDKRAAALRACDLMTSGKWNRYDLRDRVKELVAEILRWNGRTRDVEMLGLPPENSDSQDS